MTNVHSLDTLWSTYAVNLRIYCSANFCNWVIVVLELYFGVDNNRWLKIDRGMLLLFHSPLVFFDLIWGS